jgi:hypothetical protein
VGIDAAVGIQGEGQEGGGPVTTREHPLHGAPFDSSTGQVRGLLATLVERRTGLAGGSSVWLL